MRVWHIFVNNKAIKKHHEKIQRDVTLVLKIKKKIMRIILYPKKTYIGTLFLHCERWKISDLGW